MTFDFPIGRHPAIDGAKHAVKLPKLIALSDYSTPTMPTEHVFRTAWVRLKGRVSGPEDPLLLHSGLDQASLTVINELADPPDWGPLMLAFDEQFVAWSRDTSPDARVRTIVVPPCDSAGTLAIWAHTRGHTLLPDPDRIDLTDPDAIARVPDLTGDGLLVIPRLEHWFLRERNGLHALRSLLSRLARSERRCLVGCDSWAWRFIVKSAGADLALPRPVAFEAFDACRLREWFAALARDSNGITATFRLARNGEDVLACDDGGEPRDAHLRQLASLSGGIPWVAWHLWRASLKVSSDQGSLSDRAAGTTANDARTVWIVGVDHDLELPPANETRTLLVLQALLIHDGLTPEEIDTVLPTTGEPPMLAALLASGHLQRDHGSDRYRVRPTAYPAVRKALEAAGFPTGVM
ncbi:MAG: hypothetical protein ABIR16_05200 [Dokdonella sp.]